MIMSHKSQELLNSEEVQPVVDGYNPLLHCFPQLESFLATRLHCFLLVRVDVREELGDLVRVLYWRWHLD